VRVLFLMRTPVYTRNFEGVLGQLARNGHDVHVAFETDKEELPAAAAQIEQLAREQQRISHGLAPSIERDPLFHVARRLRLGVDFLRYLDPGYRDATALRSRAERRAPRPVRTLAASPLGRTARGRARLAAGLRWLERAVPPHPAAMEFVRRHRPDVLVVTPLVMFGSGQVDFLRAAQDLGVRTAVPVYSWDNLTNKGVIPEVPDLVTVWNDVQRREAMEMHGIPSERILVTGAVPYDHWFEWSPRTSRKEFCARVGLDPERPLILYVGSSKFVAPDEAPYVRTWVTRLRRHSALRDVGVLVRPHPLNPHWRTARLDDLDEVAVWPRLGAFPTDDAAKAGLYDSIHHSAAVVGVNTSAMIEGVIVGRPVHTLLEARFRPTQEGTLHFHHLTAARGGPVHTAASWDEHLRGLAEAIDGDRRTGEASRRFVASFLRPAGLESPATPRLVAALEELAARPAPSARPRRTGGRLRTATALPGHVLRLRRAAEVRR
jgi:hypothetical protein